MIRQVLMLGAGAAAGWFGHRALGRGRDAAALKAEETLKTTLHPANLGRQAGAATATALTQGARGFVEQLKQEVPAWRTASERLGFTDHQTIAGQTVEDAGPSSSRPRPTATTDEEHTA